MTRSHADHPLILDAPDQVQRVRRHLDQVGYTEDGIKQVLKTAKASLTRSRANALQELPLLLQRAHGDTPLATLLRLFFLNGAAPVDVVRQAVAPQTLADWSQLGLIEMDGPTARGRVDLLPYEGLILVADSPWLSDPTLNHVPYVTEAPLRLAHLTVRRPMRRALDLGTGCGFFAFLAARHCEQVVATDINPRALNLARFGAQLNGITNVDFRQGDLVEPVRGERFDLIVMNPPCVISPHRNQVWRDSGMRGDQFCQRVVQAVPAFLNEGGWCHLISNWAHAAGDDGHAALAAWFAGTGCDAWVLHIGTFDAAAYASGWGEGRPGEDLSERVRRLEEHVAYLEREGIAAVSYGLIAMLRNDRQPSWWACEPVPLPQHACGEEVVALFERRDFLRALPVDALFEVRVRLAPELRWEQQMAPSADGWEGVAVRIRLAGGLAFASTLDSGTIALLQLCHGERGLRAIYQELVQTQGWDAARMAPVFLQVARGLIEQGFLLPRAT